jgi:hypothetical protein
MFENSIGHVAQPTANEAIIRRRNVEGTFEKYSPEIHNDSCTKANDNSAD